jgi:hypothetical protein
MNGYSGRVLGKLHAFYLERGPDRRPGSRQERLAPFKLGEG